MKNTRPEAGPEGQEEAVTQEETAEMSAGIRAKLTAAVHRCGTSVLPRAIIQGLHGQISMHIDIRSSRIGCR